MQQASEDVDLLQLRKYIMDGKTYIRKTESEKLQKFQKILHELTLTGNKIIFKEERIVLPEKLHEEAIQLAHRGEHPGQSGIEAENVQKFISECPECSTFVNIKTSEPIRHHKVPEK